MAISPPSENEFSVDYACTVDLVNQGLEISK